MNPNDDPQVFAVFVGGIVASIVPTITLVYKYYVWKKEQKIKYWMTKKEETEKIFNNIYKDLCDGVQKNSYSIDMINNLYVMVPEKIKNLCSDFICMDKKNKEDVQYILANINKLMIEELKKIDGNIEKFFD